MADISGTNPYETNPIPRLTSDKPVELSLFRQRIILGSNSILEIPQKQKKSTLRIIGKFYNKHATAFVYEKGSKKW